MGMYLPEHEWFVGWIDLCSIKCLNGFNIKKMCRLFCDVCYALFDEIATNFDYVFYSFVDRSLHFSLSHTPLNHKQANKLLYFPLQHSRAFSFVAFFSTVARCVSALHLVLV